MQFSRWLKFMSKIRHKNIKSFLRNLKYVQKFCFSSPQIPYSCLAMDSPGWLKFPPDLKIFKSFNVDAWLVIP